MEQNTNQMNCFYKRDVATKTAYVIVIDDKLPVAEQRGGGGPSQRRQFRSQMYFYYTNRGAHI